MRLSPFKLMFTGVFLSVVLILQAFTFTPTIKELNLFTAINSNQITASFVSNGQYNGKSVDLNIKNNTSGSLKIKIPSGTLFHPENDDEQTLIQLEDDFIVLKPHGAYEGVSVAYCTESNDRCPSTGNSMKITANKNPNFSKLSKYLIGKDIETSTYQSAVWAISDGHNVSNIEAIDPATKEFRKYIATITGQDDTWFSSPQHIQIDEEGNFRRETVVITGQLEFNCEKNAQVRQDIYKENGESVLISDKYMTARYGKVTYKFTMRVRGWEKGKYFIKLHDGTDEITRYYFDV